MGVWLSAIRAVKWSGLSICSSWLVATASSACANSQAGNYYDKLDIKTAFGGLCGFSEEARIPLGGLFLNADNSSDAKSLRDDYFRRGTEATIAPNPRSRRSEDIKDTYLNPRLYRECTAIERTNSQWNGFKTLLVRFRKTPTVDLPFIFWHLPCSCCAKFCPAKNPE